MPNCVGLGSKATSDLCPEFEFVEWDGNYMVISMIVNLEVIELYWWSPNGRNSKTILFSYCTLFSVLLLHKTSTELISLLFYSRSFRAKRYIVFASRITHIDFKELELIKNGLYFYNNNRGNRAKLVWNKRNLRYSLYHQLSTSKSTR